MATKTKTETKKAAPAAKPKSDIPADLQEKVDAYAAAHNATAAEVVELAVRDFFYDHESGQRPRSNSVLEPVIGSPSA